MTIAGSLARYPAPVDADVLQLADSLDALAAFLKDHSEPYWAEWVATDAAQVRRGDGHGATHFLSALGGMGSLNDLVFAPMNGNAASREEGQDLTAQFDRLREDAYRRAKALARDL